MPSLASILEFLEVQGALAMGDPPGVWPVLSEDDNGEVHELDWSRLFPTRVLDRGSEDWDLYGDDNWAVPSDVFDRIAGETSATIGGTDQAHPGWDRCAWYQPIHFHGPAWGIFLYDQCVLDVAAVLYTALGRPPLVATLVKTLIRAGFATLFLHEQYHHKTESLAIRLHVVEQMPKYIPYFLGVYIPASGTDDQIEEGLANADSYHRLDDKPYQVWLGRRIRELTKNYLEVSFQPGVSPPGYQLAAGLLGQASFDALENELEAQVQEAKLKPARTAVDDWSLATHLNQSMFTVRQNIWMIVPKGSAPMLPTRPTWIAPVSRRALERLLVNMGFSEVKKRGKGSHRVYRKDGSGLIVLPDAKDLSPVVLRNTAHTLGMKSASELATHL